ncbi:MAG: CobW family GTP-binding protein [Pseudomonadota bacterium]
MNSPIPLTVIGGYLGTGKTTLINHLLHHANGVRLAILVNDFGDLPIDATLIESEDGNIINLSGGCVCCSYGNDLQAALIELNNSDAAPQQIVIEASGVALPGAIGSAVTLLRHLTLHGVITLVDAATVREHAKDKYLGDTIERQLTDADLVVVNKADLVSTAQLQDTIRWITTQNPSTKIATCQYAQVATGLILDNMPAGDTRAHPHASTHTVHFESIALEVPALLVPQQVAELLAVQQPQVLRAKGFVQDPSGTLKTIQVVGRRWAVSDAPPQARAGIVCIGLTDSLCTTALNRALTDLVAGS